MDARPQVIIGDGDLLVQPPGVIAQTDAIEEMRAVLHLHERHAIILPRCNSGSMARVPVTGPELPFAEAFQAWKRLAGLLPRHQTLPWAEPTCLLVRHEIVGHFGPPGEDVRAYSEHINQYGYSTVLANHAFVQKVRYQPCESVAPEYLAMEADPADFFCALEQPHHRRILYDLNHLAPQHNGTADFAMNLLRDLRVCSSGRFEIALDIQPEVLHFFRQELHGYKIHESGEQYDLAFRPAQITSWRELKRLNTLAPRIVYTIMDVIGVRCNYLSVPGKRWMFKQCAELCDAVFTLSKSTATDFAVLTGSATELRVVPLATRYGVSAFESMPGSYILVMGNAYVHKAVAETLQILMKEQWPVVVIGGKEASECAHVRHISSGTITPQAMREIFAGSRIVVYPSYYEGFGLPIVDALALGKPVVALDTCINRELDALMRDSNLHLIPNLRALPESVGRWWRNPGQHQPGPPRRWYDVAQEYLDQFEILLRREIDIEKVRRRFILLRSAFV